MSDRPDFLVLPERTRSPRQDGCTHVLDKGLTPAATEALLGSTAGLVDVVKIGWGIAYVDPCVRHRVSLYMQAGVLVSLGGTLLEIAVAQGALDPLRRWALDLGISAIEVSNVTDIGTICNQLVVDGQFYGGIAQGIGLALTEDFEDLQKHVNLRDCGLPYAKDIPDDIKVFYVETPRELGPFGAAGAGEAPLTASHVAVVNGIKNATGVRIAHLPALPEKVLAGLQQLAPSAD